MHTRFSLWHGAIGGILVGSLILFVVVNWNSEGQPFSRADSAIRAEQSIERPGQPSTVLAGALAPRPVSLESVGAFQIELPNLQTANGRHLLALYRAGIDPKATLEQKYLAMQVIMACNGYANPRILTRQRAVALSQLPADSPKRAIMEERLDVLADRCSPLEEVGQSTWRASTERLSRDLAAPDSLFAPVQLNNQDGSPATEVELTQARQEARAALETYGPVALNWVSNSLFALAQAVKDQPGRLDYGLDAGVAKSAAVAAAILPCVAGQPCGSDSLNVLSLCVGSGGVECEDSLEASMFEYLPDDASRARAKAIASDIVSAVAARDWARLGL